MGCSGEHTNSVVAQALAAFAALVAALACLCVLAASASAVVAQVPDGRAVSYRPLSAARIVRSCRARFDALFTNLDYNGGPVMPSNTNFTVYWAPESRPAYPAGYTTRDQPLLRRPRPRQRQNRRTSTRCRPSTTTPKASSRTTTRNSAANSSTSTPIPRTGAPRRADLPHGCADPARARKVRRRTKTADRPQTRVLPAHARRRRKLLRSCQRSVLGGDGSVAGLLRLPRQHPDGRGRKTADLRQRPVRRRHQRVRRMQTTQTKARPTARSRAASATSTTSPSPTPSRTTRGPTSAAKSAARSATSARATNRRDRSREAGTAQLQPGNQRAPLLVPGGVEQPGLTNACSGSASKANRRPRRSRANPGAGTEVQFDATRIDGRRRGVQIQLAVQRRAGSSSPRPTETTARPSATPSPAPAPSPSRSPCSPPDGTSIGTAKEVERHARTPGGRLLHRRRRRRRDSRSSSTAPASSDPGGGDPRVHVELRRRLAAADRRRRPRTPTRRRAPTKRRSPSKSITGLTASVKHTLSIAPSAAAEAR